MIISKPVLFFTIYRVKWIKLIGVQIKPGCVLLKESGDFPIFLQVNSVYVDTNSNVFLYGPLMHTLYFSHRYHAYILEYTPHSHYITSLHMSAPIAMHLRKILFHPAIVPKYNIT